MRTIVTEQSLVEGRLAAHMALNPTQIPTDVVNFEDFKFGSTMFEAKVGNIESLSSVSTGVSEIASQITHDYQAREKDEADKDAISIAQESNLSDLQEERDMRRDGVPVSFDGTFFTIGKLKLTKEDMEDVIEEAKKEPAADADRLGLKGEDKTAYIDFIAAMGATDDPYAQTKLMADFSKSNPVAFEAFEQKAGEVVFEKTIDAVSPDDQMDVSEITQMRKGDASYATSDAASLEGHMSDLSLADTFTDNAEGIKTASLDDNIAPVKAPVMDLDF